MIDLNAPVSENHPALTVGDLLTHTHTTEKARAFECQLFTSKWWDYRFISPVEATSLYIDAYADCARQAYSREIDFEHGRHIKYWSGDKLLTQLKENDAKAKRHFAAYWRGRCCADAIGMPYEVYISLVLELRMAAWQRTTIPLPSHLYGAAQVERALPKWQALRDARIYYATNDAYAAENYQSLPVQDQYVAYLVEEAQRRPQANIQIQQMVHDGRIAKQGLIKHLGHFEAERILETP